MKKIVITVIGLGMLFLVQGCVSASSYKDSAAGIQKCRDFKLAALHSAAGKETKVEAREAYNSCREAEARRIASQVNWCVAYSLVAALPTFGITLFILPLCYAPRL